MSFALVVYAWNCKEIFSTEISQSIFDGVNQFVPRCLFTSNSLFNRFWNNNFFSSTLLIFFIVFILFFLILNFLLFCLNFIGELFFKHGRVIHLNTDALILLKKLSFILSNILISLPLDVDYISHLRLFIFLEHSFDIIFPCWYLDHSADWLFRLEISPTSPFYLNKKFI